MKYKNVFILCERTKKSIFSKQDRLKKKNDVHTLFKFEMRES